MKTLHIYLKEISALLLVFLFGYTAISKLYDWVGTKKSLYNQVFPDWMADVLLIGLPLVELLVCVLLFVPGFRKVGFMAALILMGVFSMYIGMVLIGFFDRVPCSCGGVIDSMGWGEHLAFNLVFLGVAVVGSESG